MSWKEAVTFALSTALAVLGLVSLVNQDHNRAAAMFALACYVKIRVREDA